MVRASLTLTVPERIWIGAVSRQHPDAAFQVRSAQSCDGLGVAAVQIAARDPDEVCRAIENADAVHALDVFHSGPDHAFVQIEAEEPFLLRILDRTGVPVEMPFEISDGEVRWELTTTRTRLSTLASELDRSDLAYMVDRVRNDARLDHVLTPRQQEVVEAAIDAGYYDSPRQCTQEDLAVDLDMAKSTCSDILHRAEERIVKQFTDGDRSAFASPGQHA